MVRANYYANWERLKMCKIELLSYIVSNRISGSCNYHVTACPVQIRLAYVQQ